MTGLFVIILIVSSLTAAASTAPAVISLGTAHESVELVRCHLDEGRIVLRQGDALHVLREGDELADIGLRLLTLTPDAATIVIRRSSPAQGLRIIRISTAESGAILLREIATDPETLTSGSQARTLSMSSVARSTPPAAPPGED